MKKLLLILATVFSAAGTVFANVTVRTDGAPLTPGTVVHLSWQRPSTTQKSDVDVSYDLGSTWTEIATGLEQDSMDWTIPDVAFEVLRFRVRNLAEVRKEFELGEIFPSDGYIRSRAFIDNGSTMLSLEIQNQSCSVLRTDMASLSTTRLWYVNKNSGWGVISPSGKHVVIALRTHELVALDVSTGATKSIVQNVTQIAFFGHSELFAVHTADKRLIVYNVKTLTIQYEWQLEKDVYVGQLFFDNGRLYVYRDSRSTQYFVPGVDTSHDCGVRLYFIAAGLALGNVLGGYLNMPDLTVDTLISREYYYKTCTSDGRYVVCSKSGQDESRLYIFDRKARAMREVLLRSEHRTRSLFVSDDGRYLVQQTQFEITNIYDLTSPDKIDVHQIDRIISCLTPDDEPASFGLDGAYLYSTSGTLKASHINYYGRVLSFSPTAKYVISIVGQKMVAFNTASKDHFDLPCPPRSNRAFKWSADGLSVAIASNMGLTITHLPTQTTRLVIPLEQQSGGPYSLHCTPDLRVIVLVINGQRVIVWRSEDSAFATVLNNGSGGTVYNCQIDLNSNRVYLHTVTNDQRSPIALLYSDLGSLHYARLFPYKAAGLTEPRLISGFTIAQRNDHVITFESLTHMTTRASCWDSNGELIWTKTHPIAWSGHSVRSVVDSLDLIVIGNDSSTQLLRRSDGEMITSDSTIWLGTVLGEKAHLMIRSSAGAYGPVTVQLASSTFNETVTLTEEIASRSTISFESGTLRYRTDTTWKFISCPAAQFDVSSISYSELIDRSVITSVCFIRDELRIGSIMDSPQYDVTIYLYDIQGRAIFISNATELQPGVNIVSLDGLEIPRLSAINILHNNTPLYSGLLLR